MGFTDEQKKVIDSRDKNLIVSAAAGSGKTAVLSERIIRKVCPDAGDETKKLSSVDRMLIVTFTNAAAREMRDRIGKKLREELKKNPGNPIIRKQIAILHTAQITTIDSFCLYILRNHFEEIELDPAYSIGTEGEIKQLSEDAFDEAVEEAFKEGKQEFLNLVEIYAPKGKFGGFMELVTGIAGAVDSMPYPYKMLESFIRDENEDVWASDVMYGLKDYEDKFLKEALKANVEMRDLTEGSVLKKHYDKACDEISYIEGLLDGDFRYRMRAFPLHKPITLSYGAKKFSPEEQELKMIADRKNAYAKGILDELKKNLHYADESGFESLFKEGIIITNSLIRFVITGPLPHGAIHLGAQIPSRHLQLRRSAQRIALQCRSNRERRWRLPCRTPPRSAAHRRRSHAPACWRLEHQFRKALQIAAARVYQALARFRLARARQFRLAQNFWTQY